MRRRRVMCRVDDSSSFWGGRGGVVELWHGLARQGFTHDLFKRTDHIVVIRRNQRKGIASAFGAQIDVRFDQRYPPTINSPAETALCRQAAAALLGEDKLRQNELPSMGAEDFAYMLQAKPGCYVWLGNGPGTGGCSLHNPHYDFNDAILPIGIRYWVKLVETVL